MGISAKELANIIQVSPATISMVFNNKPGISEATKEMVVQAALKYGYSAKKMSGNRTAQGVIHLVNYRKHGKIASNTAFFSQLTEGISQECSLHNHALHVSYFYEFQDTEAQIATLKEVDCIGILLLATEMEAADFHFFDSFSIPIVVLDCYYDDLDYDCVVINNIQGAFNATSHLLHCGHKSVGYLHSSIDISNFSERADGYFKALRANGSGSSQAVIHRLAPTSAEGYVDMSQILSNGERLADAYFADNDIIAAAAMKAFQEHGYKIPEDISVIGFDDMPLCDMMSPALSTMKVRKQELGAAAVQRLVDRIHHPELARLKMCMSTKLISRDSVAVKTADSIQTPETENRTKSEQNQNKNETGGIT